jgi:uncharacterized repeat protein (TIGR03833 family)
MYVCFLNRLLIKGQKNMKENSVPSKTTPRRNEIAPGMKVLIVEKQNQPTGKLTEGVVARLLTSSPTHPHGIKVMLTDGKVGRVQAIVK